MPNIVFPGLQTAPPATPIAPIFRGTERVDEPEYLTDAFAREAIAFIEHHQRQPFFLYLAFNAVHTPMHATDKRLERFSSISDPMRRTYCAMTLALDEAVGRVLEKLRTANLEQETLVFFCSDNGGPTVPRSAVNGSRNAPLRGSKVSTLEGGIRVPFVVSWKGQLPAGKVYEQPVIQLDFLPTALAAAGVERKAEWKLDGVDLLPYLKGDASGAARRARIGAWASKWRFAKATGSWSSIPRSSPARARTARDSRPRGCITWAATSAKSMIWQALSPTRPRHSCVCGSSGIKRWPNRCGRKHRICPHATRSSRS